MGPALRSERSAGRRAHGGRALRSARVTRAAQGWAFLAVLLAVLNGPGGARAALFGARHLPRHVLLAWDPAPGEPEGVCGALRLAFWSADARLRSLWPRGEPGGSTAVVFLVSPRFLYLAHCGDSRAVLSRAGPVCGLQHRGPSTPPAPGTRAYPCASLRAAVGYVPVQGPGVGLGARSLMVLGRKGFNGEA